MWGFEIVGKEISGNLAEEAVMAGKVPLTSARENRCDVTLIES
jgi:hypothetical protein